jgi:aminoglycoside 3-N-acetyltransferase
MSEVTKATIERELRRLGLQRGDKLFVHSSLSSMGHVVGGADTVIDAILEVIGPEGTLMVPTFTPNCALFDVRRTPSKTGLITETLRRRPEAVRSWHPTHSVAAIGREAKELTRDHLQFRALGKGSPVDRLAKRGGYVLLLGVGHNRNSTVHVGEAWAEVGYIDVKPYSHAISEAVVITPDGQRIRTRLFRQPGCAWGFVKLEPHLRQRGAIRDGKIGNASVQLMCAQAIIDSVIEVVKDRPDALLCERPECEHCRNSRAKLRSLGLLDSTDRSCTTCWNT